MAARRKIPDPPWWQTLEGLAKALVVAAAAVGILWAVAGGVFRHFEGAELAQAHEPVVQQIPALAEIVTNSQATLDEIVQERGEAAQRTKFIAEACARGDYPHARCKGYPHPDDAQEAE